MNRGGHYHSHLNLRGRLDWAGKGKSTPRVYPHLPSKADQLDADVGVRRGAGSLTRGTHVSPLLSTEISIPFITHRSTLRLMKFFFSKRRIGDSQIADNTLVHHGHDNVPISMSQTHID